jgi:chemotaxis protein CheX
MNDTIKGIIAQFVDATTSVLQTMAMTEAKAGTPFVKQDASAKGDITGVIGFSNPKGKSRGTMSLTFTTATALGIVSAMIYEEQTEINDAVTDAVGELTNMISGQARKGLVGMGMIFEGAIPSVITGTGHIIRHVSTSAVLAIPFETQYGPLMVEVCFS